MLTKVLTVVRDVNNVTDMPSENDMLHRYTTYLQTEHSSDLQMPTGSMSIGGALDPRSPPHGTPPWVATWASIHS